MSQAPSSTRAPRVAFLKEKIDRTGGLEKYARRLIAAFQARNCRVTLLTTDTSCSLPNVEVVPVCQPAPLGFWNLRRFDAACRNHLGQRSYDVVFGMDRTTSQTDFRAGNGVHAAYLRRRSEESGWLKRASFSLNPLHRTILAYECIAFESADLRHLYVNSHMVRREILDNYQIDESKIRVVHNGVEWKEWQQPFDMWPLSRTESLNKLGLNPNKFQLLFVGHGYARKGLLHLLRGLALLPKDTVQLAVVGKDKQMHSFAKAARTLKLDVHFFGARDDVVSFYQVADALAIPSSYDPFANVTLEALAMGLFVVSSAHNGGKEVLTSSTGHIIEQLTDPDSIAQALYIALSRPKTVEQAHAIRQSVRAYSFETQLARIVDTSLEQAGC